MKPNHFVYFIFLGLLSAATTQAQPTNSELAGWLNVLTPATPFLNVSPIPEIQAVGSIRSVNVNPNQAGHFLNPAINARSDFNFGAVAGYMPWIRELIPGASFSSMSVVKKMEQKQAVSADFTFFRFKNSYISGVTGTNVEYLSREMAGSLGYSRAIRNNSSLGIRLKYIYSNLLGNNFAGGVEANPGQSIAIDIGYYFKNEGNNERMNHQIGASINNLGSKIAYSKDSDKDFIPASLNFGYCASFFVNSSQTLSIAYEVEKLLIPSPPVYYEDSLDNQNDPVIQYGYDPNVSVIKGMIRSFYDAPAGFREELHEITHHIGINYSFDHFYLSSGVVLEHATKGNRRFASIGAGISLWSVELNAFYLIPFYRNSYMHNTIGVSLNIKI